MKKQRDCFGKNVAAQERNDRTMKITVCIGSSCHIKGSRQVVELLQGKIAEHDLKDKVELAGTFCLGRCQEGVCVTVDGEFFSVSPESATEFFNKNILTRA